MTVLARRFVLATVLAALPALLPRAGAAATAREIDAEVELAPESLLAKNEAAEALAEKARAILVFPDIVGGGLVIGGRYGEGALVETGKPVAYYDTVAASCGSQIGVETFGCALFSANEKALVRLDRSEGR